MKILKRLAALEKNILKMRAAVIVRFAGEAFTDEDIAKIEQAERARAGVMIINRPKAI